MATQPTDDQDPRKHFGDVGVMLDASTDYGFIKLDLEGKIVGWSPGAQALLGYTEDEVLGKSAAVFHIDEDRALDSLAEELSAASQVGRVEFETLRIRKDGTRFRGRHRRQPDPG